MNSEALMHADFSMSNYHLLLKRLWWAHSSLEPTLEGCDPIKNHTALQVSKRLGKRHLLEKDLESLNTATQEFPIPGHALLTDEECWGALYVLEGSSLGGAMIYKQLAERKNRNFPLRFYGAYGSETGAMWSSFRKIFTEKTTPEEDWVDPVLRGAEKAYGHFLKATEFFKA